MEKIYIPTTTLNFNNILSTESISPAIFYEKRGFGFKRFVAVQPNPFSNYLIGYSKLPKFLIDDKDLDNYPLIIEISKELLKNSIIKSEIDGVSIYKIDRSFYLNPIEVRFIFLSQKEKDITIIKAEPSIETKLLPIYESAIKVFDKEESFEWNEKYLKEFSDENNPNLDEEIKTDLKLNKSKGAWYGLEIGNVLSKMNSKKKDNEETQKEFKKLYEENKVQSKEIIVEKTKKFLESLDTKEKKSKSDKANTLIKDNLIESDFYIKNSEDFLQKRADLAFNNIGSQLKVIKKEAWENSEAQIYINSLIANVENYQPFDINSSTNQFLKSIALFILKGDSMEKLLASLQENKIDDYAFALSLWGAVFGFSAIPKTISNILFEEENIENTKKFYTEVQEKLHEINITLPIDIKPTIKPIPLEIETNKTKENFYDTKKIIPKCPKCGAEMILIDGKFGTLFYGCTNYPKTGCKGSFGYPYVKKKESLDDTTIFQKIIEYIKKNRTFDGITEVTKLLQYLKSLKIEKKFKSNKEVIEFIQENDNDKSLEIINNEKTQKVKLKKGNLTLSLSESALKTLF